MRPSRLWLAVLALTVPAAASTPIDAGPRAAPSEAIHDFGVVRQGTVVRHTFTLKNEGASRLAIAQAEMTDPALSARLPKAVLPGSEGRITLELATDQVRGEISAGAVIHTNDPDRPLITYALNGTVEWPIDIRPLPVAFLSAFEGETKATVLTLINNESEPLQITGLVPESDRFRVSFEPVRAGREYRLVVATNPGAAPGLYQESLEVLTDRQGSDPIVVPVNLMIKAGLHTDPERLDFGSVSQSRLQQDPALPGLLTQSVFVTASNGDAFEIDVLEAMPFLQVDRTPAGPSETFRIDVTLDPERLTVGSFTGALRLVTDDPLLPEAVISVSGSVD
jgi:hypothetical protein